jgi:Uma2 family endonuclease
MPVLIPSPEQETIVPEPHPKRKRWTREELRQLIEEGHREFEQYELFDGELIDKRGKNRPHVTCVFRIVAALRRIFGYDFVAQEPPIDLRFEDWQTYRPEPDAVVLSKPCTEFESSDPGPADLLLVVETADTSLRFDLTAKARAYATAGISEYWVVDLLGRRVIVHRQAHSGQYRFIQEFRQGEELETLARPGASISVTSLFPNS